MKKPRLSTIALIVACTYVGYQFLTGNRGVISFVQLTRKKHQLNKECAELLEVQNSLERKIDRLKHRSLDLDFLEEQARRNLGYTAEGEFLYLGEK